MLVLSFVLFCTHTPEVCCLCAPLSYLALRAIADHCEVELGVWENMCGWFTITVSTGAVLNATASLAAGGTKLHLNATAASGANLSVVATSFGWNLYPINLFKSAEGLPLMPWNRNVSSA